MKRYLLIVLLCLTGLTAGSCEQETNFYLTPEFYTFVCDADGGTFDEMLFTNGVWTCEISDDAATVTPSSGDYTCPIHIEVAENPERYTKAIRLRFTSSYDGLNRYANVVVTQACHPFLFCEEPVKSIDLEGGVVSFSVNSSEAWQVQPLDGGSYPFGIEPMEGGPNRMDVFLQIPPSEEEQTLTLHLALKSDPSVHVALTVLQTDIF
jgi:hypothetical protein